MKFELTISGLCIIVLKSSDPNPEHPDAIEIIVPDAEHHTCRLSYLPDELIPNKDNPIYPDLSIDTAGRRFASLAMESLDKDQRVLRFSFGTNSANDHTVHWGPPDVQTPATPWQETWLNWIPKDRKSTRLNSSHVRIS